jgi:hypothetical protein
MVKTYNSWVCLEDTYWQGAVGTTRSSYFFSISLQNNLQLDSQSLPATSLHEKWFKTEGEI